MRKSLILLVAVLALGAGATARYLRDEALPPEPAVDLAQIGFPDLEGKIRRMDEWKGKVVVVNFWATWCTPCLKEMPTFVKLQEELASQGLQFAGIAIDDADAVREFLAATPVNYPILLGEQGGAAWAGKLGNHANVLPFSAVFDRNGHLVHVETGAFERERVLEKVMPALAASRP